MNTVKTDHPSYKRDLSNHALVNSDRNALKAYKIKKTKKREQDTRLNTLEQKVDSMHATLHEILKLLKE